MHARVVSAQVAPENLDELIRLLNERVVPAAQAQPGCRGVLTMTDPSTGKGMMISFWATPADLAMSEASGYLGRQLAAVAPFLVVPATRETFEVDIHVSIVTAAEDQSHAT